MRIIPPGSGSAPYEAWQIELDAALNGDAEGSVADFWRELGENVRALAPPMDPDFERQLRVQIVERAARRRPRRVSRSEHPRASTMVEPSSAIAIKPAGSGRAFRQLRGGLGWLRIPNRLGAGAIVAMTSVIVAAVIIAGPWRAATPREAVPATTGQRAVPSTAGASTAEGVNRAAQSAAAAPQKAAAAPIPTAPALSSSPPTPGRVQQLAASISLDASANDVQAVADGVSRLAVSDGGFVQSSRVQVQHGGTSEADLMLRLPSAKLGAALASLGQLAPVHAESQSLQDVTDAYDAARRRLADANAERQALLRALAGATTQGQIESLHERLSQARSAIAEARSALHAVSQRTSTAEVEVTVLGNAHAGSEGLTLHRGLHDAGRVLVVTLDVLLVAAAILVPLALLLVALAAGRNAWRRYQRERVLDAR